jgi:glycosyltransferase involved in cell wall biosynthesis
MRILIATGIYPPRIGGPSFYAESLKKAFEKKSHMVFIATYTWERFLPTGLRHFIFFLAHIVKAHRADVVVALDTYSVGWPAVWWKLFLGKKVVIRTGGDFLWEAYVERTREKILLSNFYTTPREFSLKEKAILFFTRFVLTKANTIIFSTMYQRNIWVPAYGIPEEKIGHIENYYGPKLNSEESSEKVFVAYTRELKWKNIDTLRQVFEMAKENYPDVVLKTGSISHQDFLKELSRCYAVVLVSLGDISPNMVLEALQYGKPVLITKENGLIDRLGDTVLYADPLNPKDIREKIELLLQPAQYAKYKERAENFSFIHTYDDIAEEFLKYIQLV